MFEVDGVRGPVLTNRTCGTIFGYVGGSGGHQCKVMANIILEYHVLQK